MFLNYASRHGQALIDRALYLPHSWAADRLRRLDAGVPETVVFMTKPKLGAAMLERAFAAGVPCAWVVGDSVYGADYGLHRCIEQHGRGAEAHRPQLHQAGARAAHVADVALVAGRGWKHSELAVAVDGYVGAQNRRAANPGNKGSVLRAVGADANGVGFIRGAGAADFDIVAAGYDVDSRIEAKANVTPARGAVVEGVVSDGGIEGARGVVKESEGSVGSIVGATGVCFEGERSAGSVAEARGIAEEGVGSKRTVVSARRIVLERPRPKCCVLVGGGVGPFKRAQQKRTEQKSDRPGEPFQSLL